MVLKKVNAVVDQKELAVVALIPYNDDGNYFHIFATRNMQADLHASLSYCCEKCKSNVGRVQTLVPVWLIKHTDPTHRVLR